MEINGPELDRYITGNYGEDQFPKRCHRKPIVLIEKPKIDAEVINISIVRGHPAIDIKMADGRIERSLTAFCIDGGFSDKLQVGTKGRAQYRSGSNYGLWFFTPNKEKVKNLEYRKGRRDEILAETRADMERAKVIGDKADQIYDSIICCR